MKSAPWITLILVLGCGCAAGEAQIGKIALGGCNAAEQGRSDKAAVAAFVSKMWDSKGIGGLDPLEVMEFKWVDLAGNGRCELVFTCWGAAVSSLYIEWQDSSQVLPGEANVEVRHANIGEKENTFNSSIRDLNGDGKKEIIMSSYLAPRGRRGADVTPVWPQVYRLQGEKYVPASADFPEFYDSEILPSLNKEIDETPQAEETTVAALEMERDKIARVLGRAPNAGLGKARLWATSGDPEMIENAIDVFRDIPGHEAEARAAQQSWTEALQRRRAAAQ